MLAAEVTKEDLFAACEFLFGEEIDVSVEFLRYLKPSGVKVAYRKKAMETHPDRAVAVNGRSDIMEQRFKEIHCAYQLLQEFVAHRGKFLLDENDVVCQHQSATFSPASRKTPQTNPEPFYKGKIPFRKLLFGQYLYYSGQITFSRMINAVIWQRRQRPSMGAMALRWGWMSPDDVIGVLRHRRFGEKFGDCALRFGYLSCYQVLQLLDQQQRIQPPIGQYFVEQKLMDSTRLFRALAAMKIHNHHYPSY